MKLNVETYCGDCLDFIKQLPDKSLDCVITDPPYEFDNHGGGVSEMTNRGLCHGNIDFMSDGFDYKTVFDLLLQKLKVPNMLIFCSNNQISKFMSFFELKNLSTTLLVWKKTNPVPFGNGKYISDAEFIVYVRGKGACFNNDVSTNKKHKIKLFPTKVKDKYHPAEKPIELIQELVELHTNPNDVIFDPFMGSGTVGVASVQLGRKFIGCEIDEKYFDVAKKRIESTNKTKALF